MEQREIAHEMLPYDGDDDAVTTAVVVSRLVDVQGERRLPQQARGGAGRAAPSSAPDH